MLRSTTPEFQSLDSFATDEFEERDPFTVSIDNADFTHNSTMPNKNGDMQPIAKEFRQHYERKLMEICDQNNPECVQAKMKLQEDWIQDLTEQNDMLIKAVFDLEAEATERVKMLEGKLKESAACACEVMNNWRGRVIADKELNQTPPQVEQLESDVRNLLKVLRRSRNLTNTCALTEGLRFYNVNAEELAEILESDLNSNDSIVENIKSYSEAKIQQVSVNGEDGGNQKLRVCLEILEAHAAAMAKDRKIDQLQMNLSLNGNNRFEESDQFRLMQENYSVLKQTMQDMRDALTAEVADKHDAIVTLRRDVQLLEEQCKRADQQTHFKDDIIKELRKELKHSKQEIQSYKSKKKLLSSSIPLTYIPMATCTGRIAAELQCTTAPLKCEYRKHSRLRKYYPHISNDKRLTEAESDKAQLEKRDNTDEFSVMHEHTPEHAASLYFTSSSFLPSSCFSEKPKHTIFTSVKETVNTARAVVDYLDLTISEGKILSEANKIMKRRQYKVVEMDKQQPIGDCRH